MQYLTAEDVANIHSVIIDETGGAHGIRNHETLAGLEGFPQQMAFGRELYPTVFDKAAVYVRTIIFNHPFIDGNKRTAMTSADVFLQLNGYHIACAVGGIEEYAVTIVTSHLPLESIAKWIADNSEPVS